MRLREMILLFVFAIGLCKLPEKKSIMKYRVNTYIVQ